MKKVCSILFGVFLSLAIIITSMEVMVWDMDWFEKEYAKYNVYEKVHMTEDDLMDVTEEMMDYLKGDRADLVVPTVVDGSPREFFNDKEKAHMVDVQMMVLAVLRARWVMVALAVLAAVYLWKSARPVLPHLAWGYCVGSAAVLLLGGAAAAFFASDFNYWFILFHETFFTNDLWLLDPRTDLLINIVPEGFFFDTVFLILATSLSAIIVLFAVSFLYLRRKRGKA